MLAPSHETMMAENYLTSELTSRHVFFADLFPLRKIIPIGDVKSRLPSSISAGRYTTHSSEADRCR
jgi:hypothetical protein